jgi:predicted nucleic acid-binding protein
MQSKSLVVDANILIRAVLGSRVRKVIGTYASTTSFFVPKAAYEEAEEHLPVLILKHGGDPDKALALLQATTGLVELVDAEAYAAFEAEARERLAQRDPEDWPVLAAALAFGCPIWTEDTDFFGCGIATWTTAGVELFLRQ